MDKCEAVEVLAHELDKFRRRSYLELTSLIARPKQTVEVLGPTGTRYYVDITVAWDGSAGGNVRVVGLVDDGGLSAFVPLSDAFIMAPAGTFVGE